MSDTFEGTAPELSTPRLHLRALTLRDSADVFAYASDPDVARFTLWPPHSSEEATQEFLRFFIRPTLLSWAVIPAGASPVVGMVALHSLNAYHKRAEIAFNLSRRYWGNGFVTEAARAVLLFAFRNLGLNRVEATCMPANGEARRVLAKLGMSHEGTLRRSHCRYDGFHDMELLSVLADDGSRRSRLGGSAANP